MITDPKMQQNKYFPTVLQEYVFYDKYSRWVPEKGRRETWPEAVERVINFMVDNCEVDYSGEEWKELHQNILQMKVMPSMRILQMAGPALERDNVGAYNCAFTAIDRLDAFSELLYVLMQGTGIGYSVEDRYVSRLPRIKKQRPRKAKTIVIPDNTEGWCDALKTGIATWYDGGDIHFDYSQIRPEGSVLKTKGGRASGPGPLKALLEFTRKLILSRQGGKLTALDCHDIACYCGYIVQVGGVRRAALISLSDLDDKEVAQCKGNGFWDHTPYRAMANNTAVYEEKPPAAEFMEEWLNLVKSGTGERGLFNRECKIPERRKRVDFGINPCAEILLRSNQFCNLSIAVARADDTVASLQNKVKLATKLGVAQSTLTHFPHLNPNWKANCEDERLLGVDITGQMDCPLFQHTDSNGGSEEIMRLLRDTAIATARVLCGRNGINMSASVTCVKPSGNSSQLLNCSSGLHVRYAPYYIRRVRTGAYTPVAKLLKAAGVPYEPEVGQSEKDATVLVFEFPVKSPDGAKCRDAMTAKEQFEYWLAIRENYTEHSASCTIYVEDHEWISLGALVYEHWDSISGLSFLPKTHHNYRLAPYEEITEEEYGIRSAQFPDIDWSKLSDYEKEDETTVAGDYACVSGACEL